MEKIVLNEAQLRAVIKESVRRVVNEINSKGVKNALYRMNMNGAKDRARNLGKTTAEVYGGKELADAGYYVDPQGRVGRDAEVDVPIRGNGYGSDDVDYNDAMEKYNGMNPVRRFFTRKPVKPQGYGLPKYRKETRFTPGVQRTDDTKIAGQAQRLNRWLGNRTSRNDFLKQ